MPRTHRITQTLALAILFTYALVAAASVTVAPASIEVKPGAQVQFAASGAVDDLVIWNLSGAGCSGITCGTITSQGLYTAPSSAPSPATVIVTATSLLNLSESGSAVVTVGSGTQVSVTVSPASVTIAPLAKQQFSATVTGSSNHSVNWTVSGVGCVAGSCGTITSGGLYTAPATIPSPALATVTATSVADPTKSQSATVVIQSASSVTVSVVPGAAQVALGAQQQFTASVTGSTNTAVKWSVSGRGCSGNTCGVISASGLYTAPASLPSPPSVTVKATSVADSSQSGSAAVTIVSASQLTVSPSSPQVKPNAQVQFSVSGPSSALVIWSISGTGCAGIACGTISSTGLYTAPSTAPTPPTVTVTATSLVSSAIGSTVATIVGPQQVNVTVSPSSVQLSTGAQQQFRATVTGTSNTGVKWTVSGLSCAGSACGTITSQGLYTAPAVAPNPAIISVTATSNADSSKSATAAVYLVQKISVSVTPGSADVAVGATQQFKAVVGGTVNTTVTWSVSGSGCSGSGCGSVSSSGLYTAPKTVPKPAFVKVTATSNADGSTSGSAEVTVFLPVTVTISPRTAVVSVNETEQFRAVVSGAANTKVSWSVTGGGCSGASCGTVNSTGLYTAPASIPSPNTVTVKAVSQADSAVFASAIVTIAPSNNSKLSGLYAFQFTGFDVNGIYQAAGSFSANGEGKLVAGHEDVNNTLGAFTDLTITGTYQVGADNRGVLTIKSPLGTNTFRFALNLLGAKGKLISFDNTGLHGSGILAQQDPTAFDPSVISGGYVLSLSGLDNSGSRIGALGLIFPSGSGFIAGSSLDVNDAGLVPSTLVNFNGTYDVDATGRGTATLIIPGFPVGTGTLNFAFYVVSANELLFISIDQPISGNPIFSGPALLQSGAPFLGSSFAGPSIFTLAGAALSGAPQDSIGQFNFSSGSNILIKYDQNSGGVLTVGGTLTGAYAIENNGRGTLNLSDPSNPKPEPIIWYIYAIAPNQAFVMDTSIAVSIGELKPQIAVLPFSNSDILGTYILGSGDPIVATAPVRSGVANFDGGSNVLGQGTLTGTEDVNGATLTPNASLAGSYAVSAQSSGRGNILLTAPDSETIAVWVISDSEFVGLNTDSTTQPTILDFQQ